MYKLPTEYTRDEFLAMENFGDDAEFTGIIIVPTDELHDSGYRMMKFILTRKWDIVGVVSGWSTAAYINGYGGYGKNYDEALKTDMTPRVGWIIDCLPASGCVRLFADKPCTVDYIRDAFSFCVEV